MDRLELMMRSIPRLQRTLRNGFTTVRDGGSGWGWIECALRNAFERGDVEGPRYLATGYHLTVEGGHACFMPYHLAKKGIEEMAGMYCNGVEEWRKAARTNIWNGVDAIKVVASRAYMTADRHYDAITAQATVEEMYAAVEEARKVNIPVISHANGKEAIMNSIEAGVNIIVHGYLMDEECASLMAQKGIYWEPTNAESRNCYWSAYGLLPERLTREEPYYPHMHDPEKSKGNIKNWEDKVKNFKKIIDNTGVRVLVGSDAGCPWVIHGLNAQEMEACVMIGMSTKQALLSCTRTAAESMGLYDLIGSVEVGKCADLVIVDGDPFEDITILQDEDKINVVLKDGKHVTSR
jgi:imidazolonepropionase-like amidohydrolase